MESGRLRYKLSTDVPILLEILKTVHIHAPIIPKYKRSQREGRTWLPMCGRGSGTINNYLLSHKWLGPAVLRFMAITVVFSVSDINYSWDYRLDTKEAQNRAATETSGATTNDIDSQWN